jgi:hypothetical protein
MVVEAVEQVNWAQGPDSRRGRKETPRAKFILTVLTWSYATGTYCSRQIAERILRDEIANGLFAGDPIDTRTLINFRRRNRDLLIQCLRMALPRCGDWCNSAEARLALAAECDAIE